MVLHELTVNQLARRVLNFLPYLEGFADDLYEDLLNDGFPGFRRLFQEIETSSDVV